MFKFNFYIVAIITKSIIILGIDPGLADMGFGVINQDGNGQLTCLDYGSIKTAAGVEMAERLAIINKQLNRIIKKHKPGLVAVEKLFFCRNVKTALIVGQAYGVAMLTAKQNKVPVAEFTPLQIKQAVSSYGQASKLQVQKMVKLLLDLDELPRPDDAADALATAICAANSI